MAAIQSPLPTRQDTSAMPAHRRTVLMGACAFAALAVAGAFAIAGASAATAQDNFYEGKQIRMIIGYGAGGGYDI